jgi:hypothetical protein
MLNTCSVILRVVGYNQKGYCAKQAETESRCTSTCRKIKETHNGPITLLSFTCHVFWPTEGLICGQTSRIKLLYAHTIKTLPS